MCCGATEEAGAGARGNCPATEMYLDLRYFIFQFGAGVLNKFMFNFYFASDFWINLNYYHITRLTTGYTHVVGLWHVPSQIHYFNTRLSLNKPYHL